MSNIHAIIHANNDGNHDAKHLCQQMMPNIVESKQTLMPKVIYKHIINNNAKDCYQQ